MHISKRAYTEAEAAEYIAMSRSFLRQDRMNGPRKGRTPGPRWSKWGKVIRYLKEDLDEFLEKHRVTRQSDEQSTAEEAHA